MAQQKQNIGLNSRAKQLESDTASIVADLMSFGDSSSNAQEEQALDQKVMQEEEEKVSSKYMQSRQEMGSQFSHVVMQQSGRQQPDGLAAVMSSMDAMDHGDDGFGL